MYIAALIAVVVVAVVAIVADNFVGYHTMVLYKELIIAVADSGKRTSDAKSEAIEALQKLVKLRKKQVRGLRQELEEVEGFQAMDEESGDGTDDEDGSQEHGQTKVVHEKVNDKLSSLLLAMQRKMRKARALVEKYNGGGFIEDTPAKELVHMLDSNLDALEKEIGE